jgi:hypothetical protein
MGVAGSLLDGTGARPGADPPVEAGAGAEPPVEAGAGTEAGAGAPPAEAGADPPAEAGADPPAGPDPEPVAGPRSAGRAPAGAVPAVPFPPLDAGAEADSCGEGDRVGQGPGPEEAATGPPATPEDSPERAGGPSEPAGGDGAAPGDRPSPPWW